LTALNKLLNEASAFGVLACFGHFVSVFFFLEQIAPYCPAASVEVREASIAAFEHKTNSQFKKVLDKSERN
jgi:hypothetical protein